jgi:hypothetical protein
MKEKVIFCRNCRYCNKENKTRCNYPDNITTKEVRTYYGDYIETKFYNSTVELNEHNDCEWYKGKDFNLSIGNMMLLVLMGALGYVVFIL